MNPTEVTELMFAVYMAMASAFTVGLAIGLLVAIFRGVSQRSKVQDEAVDRGFGVFDAQTKEFTWLT